mgnify:CR=1 FL=1
MGDKEVKRLVKCIACDIALEISLALIRHVMQRHLKENEFRKSISERKDYR